jgi:A-kinase anchor protein 18
MYIVFTNPLVLVFFLLFSYTDDTPLIRDEFLNETPVGPQDLGAEPILRVAMEECDSWSPSVPKEIVKSLKDKQVILNYVYQFFIL